MSRNSNSSGLRFATTFGFLRFCGDEAGRWLAHFEACGAPLAAQISGALVALQRHEIEGGGRRLDSLRPGIDALANEHPTTARVVRRWYFTAEAYRCYLLDDLEGAQAALDDAREEVRYVLAAHWFMVPFAVHCTDFRIQAARIARRQNRWLETKRRIEEIRWTYADKHPFCTFADGEEIWMSTVRSFYRGIDLDDEERRSAQFALDENFPHCDWIDRLEENIFVLTDFVIPYR